MKKGIGPEEIKRLTQQAIRHFIDVDFDALSRMANVPADSGCYGYLPEKYPLAWEALRQLGNKEDAVISYEAMKQPKDPLYLGSESSPMRQAETGIGARVVLDGYSKMIDPDLRQYMRDIRNGETDSMYFDSFKMLSRNIEKLLYVMNYVLASDSIFFTANYFITNGYIERRSVCVKPAESKSDPLAAARLRQLLTDDIGEQHGLCLRSLLHQCNP